MQSVAAVRCSVVSRLVWLCSVLLLVAPLFICNAFRWMRAEKQCNTIKIKPYQKAQKVFVQIHRSFGGVHRRNKSAAIQQCVVMMTVNVIVWLIDDEIENNTYINCTSCRNNHVINRSTVRPVPNSSPECVNFRKNLDISFHFRTEIVPKHCVHSYTLITTNNENASIYNCICIQLEASGYGQCALCHSFNTQNSNQKSIIPL